MSHSIKALRDQRAAKAKEARNLLDTNTGDAWSKDVEKQVDEIYERSTASTARSSAWKSRRRSTAIWSLTAPPRARERVEASMDPETRDRQKKYSAVFKNFLVYGAHRNVGEDMNILREGRPQAAQSGQQSNGSQGGYLVPTGWGAELLEALKTYGGMRSVATVFRRRTAIRSRGRPSTRPAGRRDIAESTTATGQDITFGTTNINAFKCSSKVFTVPFELLQDQGPGIDIEAYIRRAAATRIARIGNTKFTVGSGTGEPTGIVGSAASGRVLTTGNTVTIDPNDLVDLEHSVDPAYRAMPGVGWMFHDTTLRNFKTLKDS
jgi:HK97 family phage major capsid protein